MLFLEGTDGYSKPRFQRQEDSLILENRKKCIAEMFDAEGVIPAIMKDYYDIKACIVVVKVRILLTIFLCHSADVNLLFMIYVRHGTVYRVIRSCLYFNEY